MLCSCTTVTISIRPPHCKRWRWPFNLDTTDSLFLRRCSLEFCVFSIATGFCDFQFFFLGKIGRTRQKISAGAPRDGGPWEISRNSCYHWPFPSHLNHDTNLAFLCKHRCACDLLVSGYVGAIENRHTEMDGMKAKAYGEHNQSKAEENGGKRRKAMVERRHQRRSAPSHVSYLYLKKPNERENTSPLLKHGWPAKIIQSDLLHSNVMNPMNHHKQNADRFYWRGRPVSERSKPEVALVHRNVASRDTNRRSVVPPL